MISYQVYKLMHFAGIMMVFLGLGGVLISHMASSAGAKGKAKFLAMTSHGLGLLLILVGGFGMLARLGIISGLPGWAYAKLGIWLFLGAATVLARKKANMGWGLWLIFIIGGVAAAHLALFKPI